jgi:pyruvate dehydrogenase E2 component (dihydrolipoamide acetyltransferase)
MSDIRMPKLSDSMEDGLLLQWLIDDGQPVAVGDELVEIETDKAAMTYAAEVEGTLEIVVPEGTTVAVGEVIARVGVPAPAIARSHNGTQAAADGSPIDVAPRATPVARRLAAEHGVALAELSGSGPRGRITKADVLTATGQVREEPRPRAPREEPAESAPQRPRGANGHAPAPVEELSRVQQLIARRMAEAKATIPHFQVQTEVVMDKATAMRAELKALAKGDEEQLAPSVNDLTVKACALALRRHPRANGSYKEARFELHERVNVGVAIAADDALIVATVFDADIKSLGQIALETRRLAERVRAGAITPPELAGATFTVSNLGMYGMTAISPVINPPQAAILGVGKIRDTLARSGEEIIDQSLLTLTLSCDHRILYGADAAKFLAEIKTLLEAPLRLSL